ncbi:MAG TPA: homoserine dehydrogenase [Planococcus sp. (in: firmicutes)]|nr:homoserine dehydrogenase [Planococcus sp. (in: firmicutes)]
MSGIKVAILGFGTVGEGVYRTIESHQEELKAALGTDVEVVAVLIKDEQKKRNIRKDVLVTADFDEIMELPQIHFVFEAIVGKEPGFSYLKKAIHKGSHIITSNKEMFASHGAELQKLAVENGVGVGFEATVAGGVPVIQTLKQLLKVNRVSSIQGILNGTSNFILTQMREKKLSFEDALHRAQQNGFAEADPSNDIYGCDAYFKLMILSGLAFGKQPALETMDVEGITNVTSELIEIAEDLELRFKHIASVELTEQGLQSSVQPILVSQTHPFYHVEGVDNAVHIQTDLLGGLTLQGPGAGELPTSSAMIEDLVQVWHKPIAEVTQPKISRLFAPAGKQESPLYWIASELKTANSLTNLSFSERFMDDVFLIEATQEQVDQLKTVEKEAMVFPILGEFAFGKEIAEKKVMQTN